ncbi:Site-specific recombinase, resolvase family [hydrothermal vent metagenome]|uniref:Site-specific recombinase, resolvase family n=1 Tax=hydrothermal vent metagenome TaxID=652676 RepID=A0A1W1BS74_9ZZZZ
MKVGYARVSSTGQNLEAQIEILKKAGCEKIFQEKKSGTKRTNRTELESALDFVREGDTFLVTRLDRCSRNTLELYKILELLNSKKVAFKATEQEFDTSTSTGKLMVGLLSVIAEFETDLRAERQAEGIKSALSRGVKFGAKRKMTDEQVLEAMELQKIGAFTNQQIADKFGVGRSTLLRYISNYKKK